ncbi:geranylgeranyl transferas-like protein type II alpha subunit [Melanomma pulvis-pyrius CBS 109.77]|uniref:Geranylgeranyl transferase type-2 subunit alpha n=1 Tax=Melanomma pulvis-pyrius CBS 109.77 TaxID=1314802 RepID=A0A6A6XMP8_9PLEO|nr:geranylgeranyl transferas-like protein type II alpha subunit [Melanomma pulvis-pyrius CBS 109.77]
MASHGVSRVIGTNIRSAEVRQKEIEQIAAYKNLVDLVNTKITERKYTIEVLGLVTKLLNENPEYYTIWNHRRRVLGGLFDVPPTGGSPTQTPHGEELINGELQLTFALLRKFPKCYWIWNHRNWVLRKGESLSDTEAARKLWSGELQLIGKMLHADSRNFHAWSYRREVVAYLERTPASISSSTSPILSQSLAESEYEYTTKMIKTNLSNFSAWHSRAKLIPRLLNERGADNAARKQLLDSELALICTAINTDPFDQSIWYYHQFLMSTLSPECSRQNQIVLGLSNMDRQKYYAHEIEYIHEIIEDEADCKWIYVALLHLATSYLEIDGGTNAFTTVDMRSWLEQLKRLDPLRRGRWAELGSSLNI